MTDLAAVIAELRAIVEKATPRVGRDEDWRAIKSLCKSAPAMLDVVAAVVDLVGELGEPVADGRCICCHQWASDGHRITCEWLIVKRALSALAKEAADG